MHVSSNRMSTSKQDRHTPGYRSPLLLHSDPSIQFEANPSVRVIGDIVGEDIEILEIRFLLRRVAEHREPVAPGRRPRIRGERVRGVVLDGEPRPVAFDMKALHPVSPLEYLSVGIDQRRTAGNRVDHTSSGDLKETPRVRANGGFVPVVLSHKRGGCDFKDLPELFARQDDDVDLVVEGENLRQHFPRDASRGEYFVPP